MDLSQVEKLIRKRIVFTIAQLADWMECPVHVARRQLKKWGALTSYNANARYYVLPEHVDFSNHPIWQYGPAAFSSYGNLTNTVVGLVRDSAAGLTSRELGDLLGLVPRSFLGRFGKHPDIVREREGRTYVYLSAERAEEQREARKPIAKLNDQDAVVVLLCWIRKPDQTADELTESVRPRAPSASPESVTRFFAEHGLELGKKRALRSQP